MPAAARHHLSASPLPALHGWLDTDTTDERLSRITARRNFVHVKRCFMVAVDRVAGQGGEWLREEVRQANEGVDLWLLRGAVFRALALRGPQARELRHELQRALESVFPAAPDAQPSLSM